MPDNASYFHAAYLTAAVLYGGYIASLVVRARRAARAASPGPRPATSPTGDAAAPVTQQNGTFRA